MQRQLKLKLLQNNSEWLSKLTDGVFASFILVLVWVTIALAVRPI